MIVDYWGPHAWIFLHAIAYQWSGKWFDYDDGKTFFKLLGNILPCPGCQTHYKDTYQTLSISFDNALSSQSHLEKWLVELHNSVNTSQNDYTKNMFNSSLLLKQFKKVSFTYNQASIAHKNTDWLTHWWYFLFCLSLDYKDVISTEYKSLQSLDTISERNKYINTIIVHKHPNIVEDFIKNPVVSIIESKKKERDLHFFKQIPVFQKYITLCERAIREKWTYNIYFNKLIDIRFRKENDHLILHSFLKIMGSVLPTENARRIYSTLNFDNITTKVETFQLWVHNVRDIMVKECNMNIVTPPKSAQTLDKLNDFYFNNIKSSLINSTKNVT